MASTKESGEGRGESIICEAEGPPGNEDWRNPIPPRRQALIIGVGLLVWLLALILSFRLG